MGIPLIGPILQTAARFAASAGGGAIKAVGSFLGKAPVIGTATRAVGRFIGSPFGGTLTGFAAGNALFGGGDEGGGGVGDPENIQAATGDVIGTLLDGGSDSMVRAAWRVARSMGASPQSLYGLIRSMDAEPVDKMAISNELERILRPRRRRRSVVPKSMVRAMTLLKAIQSMAGMRLKIKGKRKGAFGR